VYKPSIASLSPVVVALLLLSPVFGDTIVFVNGDSLVGRVKEVANGKLSFSSDMAGNLNIPLQKIATFSTEKPFAIMLKDGTVIVSRIDASEPSTISVPDPNEPSKVDIGMLFSLDPQQFLDPRWTGSFSLGLSSAHGNSSVDSARLAFDASKRTAKDRSTLGADYARSEDKARNDSQVTQDWFRSRAKYDWFFRPREYVYGEGRFETDRIADLKRRVVGGSGLGCQIAESRQFSLAVEAGAASIREIYSGGETNRDITSQFGCNLDMSLNSRLKFINKTRYNATFKDFSDYIMSNSAELRMNLTERVFTNIKVLFDYDSVPAEDSVRTDTKYMFGLGSRF
jgi:putative salt-induced outer membrane protein YdiY